MDSKKMPPLIPQARLLKLFQIIAQLQKERYTIAQLANHFDISERTVYRYILLLEEVGLPLEKDFKNKYFIITKEGYDEMPQFTINEIQVIKKLVEGDLVQGAMKSILLKKVALYSDLEALPNLFNKTISTQLIEGLSRSIKEKRQVKIKNYSSANSGIVSDRIVEPFRFGDNFQSVYALEVSDKLNKQFKLERIGSIKLLSRKFQHESLHKARRSDIFGFNGEDYTEITLALSMKAYLLFREEFPSGQRYVKRTGKDSYVLKVPVCSFEGICRFALGLLDEVKVVNPTKFKSFVRSRLDSQKLLRR